MSDKSSGCLRRTLIPAGLGLSMLCVLLVGLSYLSNLILIPHRENQALLSDLDKARLAEAEHLRQTLGDAVWPGWGAVNIPLIAYNEETVFLVGITGPASGWTKFPSGEQRGGPWEEVLGETYAGRPYYRQRIFSQDMTPQAFTVLVGDQWVASLTTKAWTEISLAETIRADLPAALQPFLPYRLFCRLLVGDTDHYIALILHESFHAYEGQVAESRLARAEEASYTPGQSYPWDNPVLEAAWQVELEHLVAAVQSTSSDETSGFVRQFLAQREKRRAETGLSRGLIDYENLREWEEGLSIYTELETWRQASLTPGYRPDAGILADPAFHDYTTFDRRWKTEVSNIRNADGDTRFYYTGMAQAFLLDRLMPGWKQRIFQDETTLEGLLQEAVQ